MFGIEFLAVPYLTTQIAFSDCAHHPLPKVNTSITMHETAFDTSKSHAALGTFNIDTVSPYESDVHARVSGLMSGNINVSMSANIAWSTHPITQKSCMWYDTIDIKITSSPTIYIAAEHRDDRCRYNATLQHELKHIAVDEALLKKYRPLFERAALNAAKKVGVQGPFDSDHTTQNRGKMNAEIQKSIEGLLEKMKQERRDKQQQVDSRQEYDRLSRLCGGD